jgi:adenylate cyclase class IV
MKKNIELELRARVPQKNVETLKRTLSKLAVKEEVVQRLSYMAFGKLYGSQFDIRVRITNRASELVIKKGDLHAHNRIELSQSINNDQFLGLVDMISLFNFESKIAERVTTNYYLRHSIVASLVQAKNIYYLEIEKLSSKKDLDLNKAELNSLILELGLANFVIINKKEFDLLCEILSQRTDWDYSNNIEHRKKLLKILAKYTR